jgi:hypothetical protein
MRQNGRELVRFQAELSIDAEWTGQITIGNVRAPSLNYSALSQYLHRFLNR